jgi:hypothetical protein
MQTATLFAAARDLGLEIAAVLVVAEGAAGEQADDDRMEAAATAAGVAASATLAKG